MKSESFLSAKDSPIVRYIVLQALYTLTTQQIVKEQKEILNADLIPGFAVPKSNSKTHGFQESIFVPIKEKTKSIQMHHPPYSIPRQNVQVQTKQVKNKRPFLVPLQNKSGSVDGYGKLLPLLKDSAISHIECAGPNQYVSVISRGQRQITRVILTVDEMKQFFEVVSQKSKIPLIKGVFKVAVDNFLLNAIISDATGMSFIIKKQSFSMPGFS